MAALTSSSKIDAKINGVGPRSRIYEQRSDDTDAGLASTSGSVEHGIVDQDDNNTPTKSTFRSIVKRHFVKDKLFFLVNDLLKSVEEEKKAQEELIASFQTAREVTEPIRRQSIIAANRRTKRRRKRSDASLLERIEQNRKETRQSLENIDIYNKNVARVGEMKIKANESDDAVDTNENGWNNEYRETHRKDSVKSDVSTETFSGMDSDSLKVDHKSETVENNEQKSRKRSKSLPASESEKLSAIYELNRDENSSEIDKLVLNSILHENETMEKEENAKDKTIENTEDLNGNASENDEHNTSDLTVEVESSSESDDEDVHIKVVGSIDDNEGYADDDIDYIDNEDEIRKIKESDFSLPKSDCNRMPASLFPNLDPIAEASCESFQTLPSSRKDSPNIIEIEPKKSNLRVPVSRSTNSHGKAKSEREADEKRNADDIQVRKELSNEQASKMNVRKNIWVVDCEKKKSRHYGSKVEKTTMEDGRVNNVPYIQNGLSNHVDSTRNEEKDGQRFVESPPLHNHKPGARKHKEKKKERSHSSNNDSTHKLCENEKKCKSKSSRRISLDLLGMYEENTDLHRVSKSEIVPPSQISRSKGKSKDSPKRSRSKSPTKKSSRDKKKHDFRPLPPKISSASSHGRSNPTLTLFRSKTEFSFHDSSASSFEDIKDLSKNLQTIKDRLYRRPDSVLWERLDISEGSQKGRKDGVKWIDDLGFEVKHKYSGFAETNARNDTDVDGPKVTWNVPINEAIKTITSSKNVPDISKITHTVPREERVGRLYIDLKQERRARSGLEYRRLKTPDRREDIDEFSHL